MTANEIMARFTKYCRASLVLSCFLLDDLREQSVASSSLHDAAPVSLDDGFPRASIIKDGY